MAIQSEPTPAAAGTAPTPQLALQAVYLKDCSFEAPQGPRVTNDWNPQIGLDLNTAVNLIEGDLREVVLTVTVSAKHGEQTAFLVEVKQAGAFLMQNLSNEEFRPARGTERRRRCAHRGAEPRLPRGAEHAARTARRRAAALLGHQGLRSQYRAPAL